MTTILLVDDNELQRKLIRARLESEGFAVTTARNGREALELARQAPPDLVVSDVVMDELDGFGLCRRLRDVPALERVPVVLLSAHYTNSSDRELARSVGATELIERTPEFEIELTEIRRVVGQTTERFTVKRTHEIYEQQLDATAKLTTKLLAQSRDTERRMNVLLDNTNDTISVWTLAGEILEANRRWETLLGVPVSRLIGRSICELAVDPAAAARELAEIVERGSHRWTCALRHAVSHATVIFDFQLDVSELDGQPVVFAIGRDMSERVAAADRVASLEAMYRSLVEQMPDTVWRLAADFTPSFLAPNFEQLTGIPIEEIDGSWEAWRSRVHPEDLPCVLQAFETCYRELKRQEIEYRFQHRNGQWKCHHSRMTPREEQGRRFVDGLTSDITARRTLEQTLVISQRMEAIGVLTGGIAHDFNNLLSVILTNSDLLEEQLTIGDSRRADVEGIRAAAERAASLTRQLLAFSRRQVLELCPVDLDLVVAGIGKMLERMIGEHIRLTIHRSHGLGTVRADVGQLEQVLMNLVVNARDAMPDGGELAVATSNDDVTLVDSVSDIVPPGRYVVLEVTDTGCGMTADTKQHLFEPFFTTKEPGRGTGLGLSTVYGIVRQFGGYIVVHSELAKGTVFRVFLPRIAEQVEVAPPRVPQVAGGTESVLLVEDDPRVRRAVERILTTRGYRVFSASTPAEALAVAASQPIQLVISDVVMPGMSGPDVVARIRELLPSVRVLLMSGYTEHPQLHVGEIVGGPGFLQKPFSPSTLAKRVRDLLDAEPSCAT
jgi:two-component system cell cycle sensor histidine kinase/response regulator CckA